MNEEVVVVIGAGGIGQAIPNRLSYQPLFVASRASISALAKAAAEIGDVVNLVHTAGLSPVQASPEEILAVDLVGVAVVLEEFGQVIAPGGAGVVISSMAGHMIPALSPDADHALAFTPADELVDLPLLSTEAVPNSGAAYALAKRANHLRVQAEAVMWGERQLGSMSSVQASSSLLSPGTKCPVLARRATSR